MSPNNLVEISEECQILRFIGLLSWLNESVLCWGRGATVTGAPSRGNLGRMIDVECSG